MLMPNERYQAIEILVRTYSSNSSYNTYNGTTEIQSILRNGHKGFAAYTDGELMRAIQALAKKSNSHEIVSFVQQIAMDKFVLE